MNDNDDDSSWWDGNAMNIIKVEMKTTIYKLYCPSAETKNSETPPQ